MPKTKRTRQPAATLKLRQADPGEAWEAVAEGNQN